MPSTRTIALASAAALMEVIRTNPRMPGAHANAGFALLDLGRAEEAAFFFISAIDINPPLPTPTSGWPRP